ncbi:FAD-dependent monooxygenase [Dulcicalothrix desertica PCC 7102]|uniref:FAD-dependent monooxygenase n=1 Tax=Dulcicalothrix desertica PCC 7102 TaxID=232991 RepID=A0A433V8S6_9CYAN|nr:FAD-dependent monooxygenase [Dulcicalothrix desertica]RUT02520.1 FAD-dependent monooxygenase [Dulcicalothrix desertica PCC 7102]TWH55262.1 salicylate hydroxylase [Dulcicalothrix desertica PCC 7102]
MYTNTQEAIQVNKIAIVGAGLGGLACAIALRKLGYDVQVYEKAKDFRPVGGGFGLLPNGLKCLDAIEPGIVSLIKNSGCEVSQSVLKNNQGETIRTNKTARYQDKYGLPLITVWWWHLQQVLVSKVPENNIHLNHRCIGFTQDDNGVDIYFDDDKKVRADLLIGADGINSAVRETLFKDGKARYLGSMSWRAVIKCDQQLLNPGELGVVRSSREFMFLLNLGNGYFSWLYRQLLPNFFLSPNLDVAKSEVLSKIAHWGKPLQQLVEMTPSERILEAPIYDRPPLDTWSNGRVTLLGDAAHPMAPALAQGTNTTFEDVCELAWCFAQYKNISEAFNNYERRRIDRTRIIQNRSAEAEMDNYKTQEEKSPSLVLQQLQMSNEEFQDWILSYQPPTI